MAKLEMLELGFNACGWDRYGAAPAGIEHLSGLKKIEVCIYGWGARESNKRAAEAALRNAIGMHPCVHLTCSQHSIDDMGEAECEQGKPNY